MTDIPDLVIETDYHTSSEYQPDFDSDKEPPVDKLIEKKMIHKGKELRIYKRILKFGKRGFDRPAKYDRVDINFKEVEEEIKKIAELNFEDNKEISIQLGKGEIGNLQEYILSISTMKKGEIAWFEIEEIYFDKNKDRKLKGRKFFVIGLKNFITIIDVNGDKKLFKIQIEKGRGLHRIMNTDEIKGALILRNSKFQKIHEFVLDYEIVKEFLPKFQKKIKELSFNQEEFLENIFCNLKNNEQVLVQIPKEFFDNNLNSIQEETKPFYIKENCININGVKYETEEDWVFLDIKIDGIRYLEDVFQDQTVVKKVLKNGYTTSKPEDLSKIYFDFKILINKEEIYTTFKNKNSSLNPQEEHIDDFYEKNSFNNFYNKEYYYSKFLEGTLQQMKKLEEAELTLKGINKFKYGKDFQIIKKFLDKNKIEFCQKSIDDGKLVIQYIVVMYYFKEGVNSFTINSEERLNYIKRRKEKVVEFIKDSKYKKALKLLGKINHLTNYGVYEEDKKEMGKFILSSHLNSSLCYWKMKDWKNMLKFSNLVLEIDSQNLKGIYRAAFAMYKLDHLEKTIECIQRVDFRKSKELMNLMSKARNDYKLWKKKEKKIFSNLLKND